MWRARARTREEERTAAVWAGPLWLDVLERFFPFPFICLGFLFCIFFILTKPRLLYAYKYIASTWLTQWGPQDVS
jgi:hypothetical protein